MDHLNNHNNRLLPHLFVTLIDMPTQSPWTERAAKALTVVLYILVLIAFIALGLMLKDLLKLFVFGLLVNYLLSNPVRFLTRFLKIKAIAIFLCFSLIIMFFVTLVNLLCPIFMEQWSALGSSLPELSVQIEYFLANTQIKDPLRNSEFSCKAVKVAGYASSKPLKLVNL